ncbi:MAG: MFS transporter [Sphingomonadales bacterium]|jgi:MFS family permease|nr:MFS transporter [Sphingomonadales bacterium]
MTVSAPAVPQSPLAYRDYRLFWIARFSAVVATMAMVVILGWQVYDTARNNGMSPREAAPMLAWVGAAQFLPVLFLTPVAGWAADRFERRRVAIIANMVDMLVALALAVATARGGLTLPFLFIMAMLHGVARVFVGPAMSSIAPNVVPPEVLPRAIAMSSIAWQSASVLGPAAAGFIYADNPANPYWAGAALLVLSSLSVSFIKPIFPPQDSERRHPVRLMVDGLRFVWSEHFLLGAITLDLFAVLLGGATAMLPVYARDILHVGTEGLGWLRGAPGAGAAIVALWLAFRPLKHDVGVKMLLAVVVFGVATIIFGLSKNYQLSLAMLALLGAADMLSVYVRGSLVQLNTPDAMRGRVSAVSGLAISASNELGEVQSGAAAALLGPVGAVVFGGVGAIFVTGLWAWLFPELRNARTFEPQFKERKP